MKHSRLLIILTRNPEYGKCKTRLAATIGKALALDVYKFLLAHTVKITKAVRNTDKVVYYSEKIVRYDIWEEEHFKKALQKGQDLGERMKNAFEIGFKKGYSKIIVIGSDLYDLSAEDLENAFESLDQHEAVLGPAEDGGYYLFGATSLIPEVFQEKEWGSNTVLRETLDSLKNFSVKLLPVRNDVDYYEDIKDHPAFQELLKSYKNDQKSN